MFVYDGFVLSFRFLLKSIAVYRFWVIFRAVFRFFIDPNAPLKKRSTVDSR